MAHASASSPTPPTPSRAAPAPATAPFDLSGGRHCLDFVNTLDSGGDRLQTYTDFVAFCLQSREVTPDDAAALRAEALEDPISAEGIMVRGRRVRNALRELFIRLIQGRPIDSLDLTTINLEMSVGFGHSRVFQRPGAPNTFVWGWAGRTIDRPLWAILRSAADLLVSDERTQLRECSADDCHWLFLDTTRNRSRQWCSMTSCGNRAKARRHYARGRATRPAAADDTAAPPTP